MYRLSSLEWKHCFIKYWSCIKITNIYQVIRPFYYVAKFYGFAPFQLNGQQLYPEHVVTNTVDWIIISFSLCGYLFILITTVNDVDVDMPEIDEHIIVTIFRGILYVITICMSIVCMVSNLIFRKNLWKVANDLHDVDYEVNS